MSVFKTIRHMKKRNKQRELKFLIEEKEEGKNT